jgi:hypothetical protein
MRFAAVHESALALEVLVGLMSYGANVGEKLRTQLFITGTRGFAAPEHANTAEGVGQEEDVFHHGPMRLARGGGPGGPANEAVDRVAMFRLVQREEQQVFDAK